MKQSKIVLEPLTARDREQFISDNQLAFRYGALEEFGMRDDHLDGEGEIISRKTIEASLDGTGSEAYRILFEGRKVGGVVLEIDSETNRNHLALLFVSPEEHGKGIGFAAWKAVEELHPETAEWETFTPYFEKRNIHFYINKCGFQGTEFFNEFHSSENQSGNDRGDGPSEMFRFVKVMK